MSTITDRVQDAIDIVRDRALTTIEYIEDASRHGSQRTTDPAAWYRWLHRVHSEGMPVRISAAGSGVTRIAIHAALGRVVPTAHRYGTDRGGSPRQHTYYHAAELRALRAAAADESQWALHVQELLLTDALPTEQSALHTLAMDLAEQGCPRDLAGSLAGWDRANTTSRMHGRARRRRLAQTATTQKDAA